MNTYIDLFAGCGGLSLGLHAAGWQGLFAIEKDPMAFETFTANFLAPGAPRSGFDDWPDWLPKGPLEITTVLSNQGLRRHLRGLRGLVDLVAGGPPCQGFSVGGSRNGTDTRNELVHQFLDFVSLVEPRAVLVENVPGMARRFVSRPIAGSPESVADAVCAELREMGYKTTTRVLDSSRFGVPQLRHRLVIFGLLTQRGTDINELFDSALSDSRDLMLRQLRLPGKRRITAREAIDDLDGDQQVICPDSPKFMSGTYKGPAAGRFAQLMRGSISSNDVPDSHRFSVHGSRILAMYELAHSTQKRGRLPASFMLRFGTKKDKKVLIDPGVPVSTITTHPDEFIHYSRPRNVTIREMARLQSFPDNFVFRGRYTINGPRRRFDVARCSQVGNAVPPLLAQAIGITVKAIIDATSAPQINRQNGLALISA